MTNQVVSPLVAAKQSIAPTDKKFYKSYKKFFEQVTGFAPFPYQLKYHKTQSVHGYKGLSVPTGAGKTNCVIVDWLYRRIHNTADTPRRLFLCVPLRTLVTQLTEVIKGITERSGLEVPVYQMLGGNIQDDFVEKPEEPAIVICTLDQLCSRALLRPYTASVKSSLMHFSAVNDDCTIVLDETQLHAEALGTSIQLHELLLQQPSFHNRELVLCSATNDTTMVDKKTFEFAEVGLSGADYRHPVMGAKVNNEKTLDVYPKMSDAKLVELAEARHKNDGLTLIICNTVARAQSVYSLIDRDDKMLLHSRFRKADRAKLENKVVNFNGVVVSTQVIECGLDISADVLVTELCPWSSLVQRSGRVARKANTKGEVHVIESNKALPYAQYDLDACSDRLFDCDDFSIKTVMSVPLPDSLNKKPTQIDVGFIKRMFDPRNSEPISQYVRQIHVGTCSIAWRFPRFLGTDMPKLDALEKCPVYPTQLLEIINKRKDVWVVDEEATSKTRPFRTVWRKLDLSKDKIEPGLEVCVGTAAKNYCPEMGLLLGCKKRVKMVKEKSPKRVSMRGGYGDESKNKSLGLVAHLSDTANYCSRISKDINLHFNEFNQALKLSGWLHDWGKGSHVFQTSLLDDNMVGVEDRDPEMPLAKAKKYLKHETGAYIRRGWRHCVMSAMAMMEAGCKDSLAITAVCAHHGHAVSFMRSLRDNIDDETSVCGIQAGDTIPAIRGRWKRDVEKPAWANAPDGYALPEVTLGDPHKYAREYREHFDRAYTEYGPLVIATFGSLLRVADHRASAFRSDIDTDD